MDRAPNEIISMYHPELEQYGTASHRGFVNVWEPRGWQEVDAATVRAGRIVGRAVPSLDALGKEELAAVADEIGAEHTSKSTKADLAEAVTEASTPAAEKETSGTRRTSKRS